MRQVVRGGMKIYENTLIKWASLLYMLVTILGTLLGWAMKRTGMSRYLIFEYFVIF